MIVRRRRSRIPAIAVVVVALLGLAACGASGGSGDDAAAPGTVTIGALSNGAARETTLTVPVVEQIRAELPQRYRDTGVLEVGLGVLPAGTPPLGYVGTDDRTLTGSEPDLARLVGAVLGLRVELGNATWENLFVGLDSGRTDVAFSNVTVTEQRKQKYDFASYRQDNLAFETLASSPFVFTGDIDALVNQRVSVARGTNQERILLAWRAQLEARGASFRIVYYPDINAVQLALESGQIDAHLGSIPAVTYQVSQSAGRPSAKRITGAVSGAGGSVQGLIGATTRKDSGLVKPISDAINHLIATGQYQQWLAAWNLTGEAVPVSLVDPPGLPASGS